MFTILSLFTEDVKLRHGSQARPPTPSGAQGRPAFSDSPSCQAVPDSPRSHFAAMQSSKTDQHSKRVRDEVPEVPSIPLLNPQGDGEKASTSNSVHPGIIARANIDTTIAVIPAQVCSTFSLSVENFIRRYRHSDG
jgi:hypothetical protein